VTGYEADLDVARMLAAAGIPVFCAYPDPGGKTKSGRATGYILPPKWEDTKGAYVDAWKPGMALCAVMGHALDLVDVDPRNGGDLADLDGIMPMVYAEAATPSGGRHFFVASMGVRSHDAVRPGIDVKAGDASGGRGFAFIAPTIRKSKVTGEPGAYRWTVPPDAGQLTDTAIDKTGRPLADLIRQARPAASDRLFRQPPSERKHAGPIPDGEHHKQLVAYAGWLRARGFPLREAEACMLMRRRDLVQAPGAKRPVYTEAETIAELHDVYGRYDAGDPAAECAEPPGGELGAQVVRLADVKPERISWLWEDHLPLGKLVVLDGDPGVGKSSVSLDIAARVTTGSPMPDGSAGSKGSVLVLSAEDGLADTIRPRLDAAGADAASVITITDIKIPGGEDGPVSRPVSIPADLPAIEKIVTASGVKLVIIDVLMAYLGGDVNAHLDQDIRRALHALASMAERTGCCVLVLRHLKKSGGPNALYRGGGSIGIIGAARAGFMCGLDPDDETGGRRVLANVKMNIAAEPPSLAYYLVPDHLHGVARVQWDGVSEHKAGSLLTEPPGSDERTERDEAAEWLTGYLTDQGGEAAAKDVKKAARADGIAERTLDRARSRAKVTTGRSGFGKGAVYVWRLDLSCTPHARHERQPPDPGKHGEHGGEHGEPPPSGLGHEWPEDQEGWEANQ
jgi:hypothetical protein